MGRDESVEGERQSVMGFRASGVEAAETSGRDGFGQLTNRRSGRASSGLRRAAGRLVAARSLFAQHRHEAPCAHGLPAGALLLRKCHRTLGVLEDRRCRRCATGVVQECAREGTPPGRPAR